MVCPQKSENAHFSLLLKVFFWNCNVHKNKSEFVSTLKWKLSAPSTRKLCRILIEVPKFPEGPAVISYSIKLKLHLFSKNSQKPVFLRKKELKIFMKPKYFVKKYETVYGFTKKVKLFYKYSRFHFQKTNDSNCDR